MILSKQYAFCRICGNAVLATAAWLYSNHGCCSKKCLHELHWRYTLSIMGKEYYPDSRPITDAQDCKLVDEIIYEEP